MGANVETKCTHPYHAVSGRKMKTKGSTIQQNYNLVQADSAKSILMHDMICVQSIAKHEHTYMC